MILMIIIQIIQTLWLMPIMIWRKTKYSNFIVIVPFSGIMLTHPLPRWWHTDHILRLMASLSWQGIHGGRMMLGGFFLLFGNMMLVLIVSSSLLLGLLSVIIAYLLMQSTRSLFIGSQSHVTSTSTIFDMFYIYQIPVLCSFCCPQIVLPSSQGCSFLWQPVTD